MSNIEYEAFKNYYLQHPITFLTEENLDKLETHCRKAINYERGVEHKVVLELLERYKEYLAERQLCNKEFEITYRKQEFCCKKCYFKNRRKLNKEDKP